MRRNRWRLNQPWYKQWKRWTKEGRRNLRAARALDDDPDTWIAYWESVRAIRGGGAPTDRVTPEWLRDVFGPKVGE